MIQFLERFVRNLAIIALLAAAVWVLLKVFYPAVVTKFTSMELFFGGVRLWPVLLVLLLLLALPLRKP